MNIRMLKGIVLLCATAVLSACKDEMKGEEAYLSFTLSSDYSDVYMRQRLSRILKSEDLILPDTNDFILTVNGPGGEIYNGPYGERPDPIKVQSGSYDVSLNSIEFERPGFSTPLFGDYRTVVTGNGQTVSVAFNCTQLNCGMKLIFTDSFKKRFPTSGISIQSDGQSLNYPYTETRTAYFDPGILRVICDDGGNSIPVLSRQLEAADMLTIKLSASAEASGSFSVSIDTARNWMSEDYTLGSGNDGSTMEKAMAVSDLALNLGAQDVWVTGYIVGGDVTTSNVVFSPPFTKESNLAISDNRNASAREDCAAIELPSSGEIREAVNLVDHPQYIGRRLYIKGDIENYFGHPGVKSIKEFLIE
ncbi:MAG TPA: DUF4493 domain-containing protein [Candidatus Coprenecus pullistercoris]|nr:DUF4493 domain-containing protein [Candidatus Coprenecus pullistercoris]